MPLLPHRVATSARLATAMTVVAALALVVSLSAPGPAAGDDDVGRLATIAELAPDPGLDPRIMALEFSGTGWNRAVAALDAALFDLAEAQRERRAAAELLDSLRADRQEVVDLHRRVASDRDRVQVELAAVDELVRARAVDLFVNHGDGDLEAVRSAEADAEAVRADELAEEMTEVTLAERAELRAALDSRTEEVAALDGRVRQLDVQIDSTAATLAAVDGVLPRLEETVPRARQAVVSARRNASIPGLAISVTALDAYLNAADLLAGSRPSCNARWWMIAGVARVESWHGTYGGRSLRADGRPSTPIIGIALDGRPGVRVICDTDDGRYDGDTIYDRAVGPLQFIPETWRRLGRDGNGDGVTDPQNIYDAAYSTGRYLCALGGDLSSTANLRAAYFGYNTSTEYVDDVHGYARRYAEAGF